MLFRSSLLRSRQNGFTLIELLMVVAIIGLLAGIILSSISSARAKSRDARRKLDLNQIYNAMMLFYDTYGCLPKTSATTCSGATGYSDVNSGSWDYSSQGAGFMGFLETSGLMSQVPVDPINDGTGDVHSGSGSGYAYAYYCYNTDNTVVLRAKLETGAIYSKTKGATGSYREGNVSCQ